MLSYPFYLKKYPNLCIYLSDTFFLFITEVIIILTSKGASWNCVKQVVWNREAANNKSEIWLPTCTNSTGMLHVTNHLPASLLSYSLIVRYATCKCSYLFFFNRIFQYYCVSNFLKNKTKLSSCMRKIIHRPRSAILFLVKENYIVCKRFFEEEVRSIV